MAAATTDRGEKKPTPDVMTATAMSTPIAIQREWCCSAQGLIVTTTCRVA
jgi:hypothetical protein